MRPDLQTHLQHTHLGIHDVAGMSRGPCHRERRTCMLCSCPSQDKVTSLYMHLVPVCVSWAQRWHPEEARFGPMQDRCVGVGVGGGGGGGGGGCMCVCMNVCGVCTLGDQH